MKAFPCKVNEWNPDAETWVVGGQNQIKVKGVWQENEYPGMDLRDYFAAKAMQELLNWDLNVPIDKQKGIDWAATYSYKISDAMMKAREK